MLPFKISSVVVCDDARLEQNNKHILIGVYNGTIVVPAFPTDLQLTWWIQLFPERAGEFDLEVQIVKDDTATLLRAALKYVIQAQDWSAMVLPKTPVQLQSPGLLKLQFRMKDEQEWETVTELTVRQGEVSPVLPTAIPKAVF